MDATPTKSESPVKAIATIPAPVRKVQELSATRMKECEFERTNYVITAHENTDPEDLLDPAYWSTVAAKLKPWDKIEARADDGSWYAEFIVLDCSRNWARVYPLCTHHLTSTDVSQTQAQEGYEIAYKGPMRKWTVIRKKDSEVIHEGEASKAGAYSWLGSSGL